jgi:hypothetical protein
MSSKKAFLLQTLEDLENDYKEILYATNEYTSDSGYTSLLQKLSRKDLKALSTDLRILAISPRKGESLFNEVHKLYLNSKPACDKNYAYNNFLKTTLSSFFSTIEKGSKEEVSIHDFLSIYFYADKLHFDADKLETWRSLDSKMFGMIDVFTIDMIRWVFLHIHDYALTVMGYSCTCPDDIETNLDTPSIDEYWAIPKNWPTIEEILY